MENKESNAAAVICGAMIVGFIMAIVLISYIIL